MLRSSKDLSRSDSCSDPCINLPTSAIKRTVFLFSSSILRRNDEDASSGCGLGITGMLLSSVEWPPMLIIRLHKRPAPRIRHGGRMCNGTLQV